MQPFRQILSVCALLLCNGVGAAVAQDLYRTQGRWSDDQAGPIQLESLRGSFTVLTMAYGACRRICSTSVRLMQSVQALADFRARRKLMRSNWSFLSGDAASTRQHA
jgi:cytochrome oxidase Cu insertion factor (SCO1/SenC/PrrC family)